MPYKQTLLRARARDPRSVHAPGDAFAPAPGIRDEERRSGLIVECSGAGPDDTVLDVACGPGLVVAAFGAVVRHATGIESTGHARAPRGRHAASRA